MKDLELEKLLCMNISGVSSDSRKLLPSDVYVSIKGALFDGDDFALHALNIGASFVVTSMESHLPPDERIIRVANPRKALALIANKIFAPKPKYTAAVTGTSGKTSVAYFYYQILNLLGIKSGYIGTLGVINDDDFTQFDTFDASLTSPDPVDLNKLLFEMKKNAIDHVAIEASSHGLDQYRLDGININAAAFTNFSRDHLDYHNDMESYFSAKKRLFTDLLDHKGVAVINRDIPQYGDLHESIKCEAIIDYGFNADFIKIIDYKQKNGVFLLKNTKKFEFQHKLLGTFQAYNLCAAIGLCIAHGIDAGDIFPVIEHISAAPGRLEYIGGFNGASIFIDYAHKPDALESILKVLRNLCDKRIILVFGCGGNRDMGKRPVMGLIAKSYADVVIVTDDNPRLEDQVGIRRQILDGCTDAIEIGDRASAIANAVGMLQQGDILLVAGKGSEKYQIIGDTKINFSDKDEILKNIL